MSAQKITRIVMLVASFAALSTALKVGVDSVSAAREECKGCRARPHCRKPGCRLLRRRCRAQKRLAPGGRVVSRPALPSTSGKSTTRIGKPCGH